MGDHGFRVARGVGRGSVGRSTRTLEWRSVPRTPRIPFLEGGMGVGQGEGKEGWERPGMGGSVIRDSCAELTVVPPKGV